MWVGCGDAAEVAVAEAVAVAFQRDYVGVVDESVDHGGGDDVVAEHLSPASELLVGGDDQAGVLVAGGDELEEQVRRFGFEGDVANLIDDQQRIPGEPDELSLQPAGVVGLGEPVDPLGGGGEQHPVPGLAGPDAQPGREMGLPGSGGPRKITFSLPVTKSKVPRCRIRSRFSPRAWSKSNSSRVLRPGNRAARIRLSPPCASRAATSRCRHAARYSSCDHASARARSASRLALSRSAGAFSARVKNARSAATSLPLRAAAVEVTTPPHQADHQ